MKTWGYFKDILHLAVKAKSQSGKSIFAQIRDIVQLRRVQLGPSDYYFYRLFDDSRFSIDQKKQYTNWRFRETVYRHINDVSLIARSGLAGGWGGAVDKVLYHYIMSTVGIPVPRILAIYDPAGPFCGSIQVCMTLDQVARFIEAQHGRPFFMKPAREGSGSGAMAVDMVSDGRVRLSSGLDLEMNDFLSQMASHGRVIFQERLKPHPILRKYVGLTMATVRVVILVRTESSEIYRTVLRVPVGKNMCNNFHGGKTGNLLGWVNSRTGEVERVFRGCGLDQTLLTHHPDTEEPLQGLKLPDWDKGLNLVLKASRVLRGMGIQTWDLALTDTGPVLVEVNDMCSEDVLQLAGPPGMLDEQLSSFLREHGFSWTYPSPVKQSSLKRLLKWSNSKGVGSTIAD